MELSVEQIFASDHATVSRYMADHPECIEEAVHDHLLSHPGSARDALKTCLWILCGGEGSPAEVKQEVEKRRAGKSNVCGRIWKNGDMAYKCRNCGYDEPCAVCVECFQEGDHKGHDCDCGDPLAWRPEGNCRHHVGTSGVDPSELLTPRQRTAARATLRAVVRVLAQTLLRVSRLRSRLTPVSAPPPIRHLVPPITQPVTNEEVQAIAMQVGQGAVQCGLLLNWLQHVVDFFGDPLRRLLCLAVDEAPLLAGEPDGPPPAPEASAAHKLVIQFLLMDHLLPDPLQEEVRKWYFTLIGDTQYKMLFSIYYVKTYPFLVDVYIEEKTKAHKSKYETVLTMSTQFFHPHLIPHLVQNAGLLDMLVDTTYKTLRTAFLQAEEAEEERRVSKEIDTSSAVLRKRLFWILCYDLRAVTAVPAVVQPLVAGALATLERFVRLWDLFQGMDPTPRRRIQSHVPVESNSWVHAFTLEIEMIEAVTEQVADGVEVLTEEALAQPETLAHARTALRRCLDALLSAAPLRYRLSPDGQLSLEVAPGAAQTEEVGQPPHATHYAAAFVLTSSSSSPPPSSSSAGQDDDDQESEDVAGLERPGKPAGTGQLVALPWAGGRYRVADYDVHRHSGVSFHITLHRLLTRLLVAASLVWRAPLHNFFPDASKQDLVGYALSLLEDPLRIQVLGSQASSGAWVRNGYGLIQASSVYTTQVEAEGMMNADVAALQVAATLLRHGLPEQEADLLVPALLHRFTLSRYFDWAAPEADDGLEAKHKQALAENFLRLAINLLNDRTVVGPPRPPATDEGWKDEHHRLHMQDLIVRTVVHALACGPKTHSQVVKAVGERMLKHRHGYFPHVRIQTLLEQVMAQTADFTPPSGPSHPTGTFALKPACLALFDPYYLHYTRQEQQAAIEFYHVTAKKLRPAHASGVALPSLRAVPEVIREGAASVACSRTLMAVLFAVLHHIRAARQPDAPASTLGDIALLHPTLTLLKLILQFHAAHPATSSAEAMDEEKGEEACEVGSLFDVQFRSSDPAVNMCQQFVLTRVPGPDDQPVKESVLLLLLQESDDLAEYRDALTEVVGLVETHGGARVQAALSQLTVLLDEERRAREAAAQKEALRRRRLEENKARQQAILAKFAAQQKAFVETAARQEGAGGEEGEAEAAEEEETAAVPVPVPDKLAPANGGDAALADGAQPSSDLVCVLCKEGAQPGKGLGYVALVQHSHVLPVAKRQHVGKLHRPHYRLLADFLRTSSSAPPPRDSPPSDRKGKRKAEGEEQEETPMETAPTDQAATSQEETTDEASGGGDEEDKEARRKEEAAREEKRARARRWCAELEREVEGSGGAVVNSCGHLMHPECRHQYSLSVARDSARGRLTVDPMLTPSALAQADEGREWEAWLGRVVAPVPPTEEAEDQKTATTDAGAEEAPDADEESVRTTLHDFATRVYCAQNNVAMETVDLVPAEFEPHLWSLAACMTSALELATRSDPVLATAGGWSALFKVAEERRGSTLRTTCRALLAYGRTLLRGDRQRLRRADGLLRRSLVGAAAEEGDSGAAFLRGDMFAHFVRRYFLDLLHLQPAGNDEAQQGAPLHWARLLYVGALAQAAVTLAATLCSGSALDEEGLAMETATAAAQEEQKAPLAALLDGIASASGGALGLTHAEWTTAQWERFAEELVHLLLPFARRVALFLHLCGGLPAPALPESPASPRQGAFAALGSGAESELVRRWLQQLLSTGNAPRELQLVAPDLPFHFDRRALPFLYQDLVFFRAPAEAICLSCGQVPRQPGLCLFCNRLVCVGSTCCAPQDKPGECNTHALSCAGGEGVFLLARQTITLLLQSQAEHGCLMGSLYLDEHKEEDVGLKRGRPLYLDPARYEQLRTLWLDHQMAASITRRAPSQNVHWTQL
ncbi:zinc finger in N-recognin protein [Acanthamoeba castellanii str. Neff]|uniref:E3 ubiquitin-protein ligase n=1 Tax=Acanthamoeba castellanii (strain ATCC 30010 / Neff) TaxID=1257118 RepID=L8H743_ACACF|nr:zinc finger in N-recognin protein [Acanthamoeba castellanii str. Neff]ELR21354.1 zinc finger in N-recognin protein [Acanthamoeba castellanii str. Neff]